MEGLFSEIGIVIITSALIGVVGYFLRQPLILAYIAAGIILGPSVSGILHDIHFIEAISHIGVMLMLFLIGLEMNTNRLKDLGGIALVVGIGQVVLTSAAGYGIATLFGFSGLSAVYIAIALAFSSTVIAVKILSEKRDLNSLYGQITVGVLIVQDVLAILSLVFLGGFGPEGGGFEMMEFVELIIGGTLLTAATMTFAKHFLSVLYSKIASSQELLILFSLAWCFIVAILAQQMGFSMEIGAFIAGINLANLPYTFEINAKAKLLRDFFITIFFVSLGAGMQFSNISSLLLPFAVFTGFILIGNPSIVMFLMGLMGYDRRQGLYTGLTIANMSEFSLILLAMGLAEGHIPQEVVSLLTMVTIVTMVFSSYAITYNTKVYDALNPYLKFFEFRKRKKMESPAKGMRDHIILLGYGDTGRQILKQVKTFKDDYVVVDHDNTVINGLIQKNIPCVFGDVEDEELLDDLGLEFTEIIISTLPNEEDNYFITKKLRELPEEKRPVFIAVAETGRAGLDLFVNGADYIIVKSYLGANQVLSLNKELYSLSDRYLDRLSKHNKNPLEDKFAADIDYASFLENLQAIRLKELRGRFSKSKRQVNKTSTVKRKTTTKSRKTQSSKTKKSS